MDYCLRMSSLAGPLSTGQRMVDYDDAIESLRRGTET